MCMCYVVTYRLYDHGKQEHGIWFRLWGRRAEHSRHRLKKPYLRKDGTKIQDAEKDEQKPLIFARLLLSHSSSSSGASSKSAYAIFVA